jgi:hypothetical protein
MMDRRDQPDRPVPQTPTAQHASGDYREWRFRKSRAAGSAANPKTRKSPAAMAGL